MKFTPQQEEEYKKRWAFEQALQRQQRPQQKSGGSLFDPSAWIRELGGSGGAIGGAAMGAPLGIPGMIGGGVLGAFLGGGAGSAVEQQIRDKKIDLGKVGGEAVQEGMFGALPGLFKGVGVLRHAPKGARMSALMSKTASPTASLADDAAKAAGYYDEGARGLKVAGQKQVAQARGITPGVGHTATRTGLSPDKASFINKYLDKIGLRKGSSLKQLRGLETHITKLNNNLDELLTKSNKMLPKGTVQSIKSSFDDIVKKTPGLEINKSFTDDLAKLSKTRSTKSLTAFKRQLDDLINYSRSAQAVNPKAERAYRELRKAISNHLVKVDPKLAKINKELSTAFEAKDLLMGGVKSGGHRVPLTGSRLPGALSQNIQNKTGRALQFMGGGAPKFAQSQSGVPIKSYLASRALTSTNQDDMTDDPLGLGISEQQLMQAIEESGISPEMVLPTLGINQQDPMAQEMGGMSTPQMSQDTMAQQAGGFGGQQSGMTIPREAMVKAMMADLQSSGGKNIDKLIKFFEFANYDALNNETNNLSSKQKEKLSSLATVEASLDQLEQGLNDSGGGQGIWGALTRNIGTKIPGMASDARVFEGIRSALIAPLARTISGEVGVLTDRDIKRAEGLLPKLSDTAEEAKMRIQNLRNLIEQNRNIAMSPEYSEQPDNGVALEQALGGFGL